MQNDWDFVDAFLLYLYFPSLCLPRVL